MCKFGKFGKLLVALFLLFSLSGCGNHTEPVDIVVETLEYGMILPTRCLDGTLYYMFTTRPKFGSKGYGFMAPVYVEGELQLCGSKK